MLDCRHDGLVSRAITPLDWLVFALAHSTGLAWTYTALLGVFTARWGLALTCLPVVLFIAWFLAPSRGKPERPAGGDSGGPEG